jgi:hypothetical protein
MASWNPFNCNQFLNRSSKLELYEVVASPDSCNNEIKLKSSRDVKSITCADWYPLFNDKATIAFGSATGTVSILNLNGNSARDLNLVISNIPSKRVCNSVSWNKFSASQLAAGFENIRRFVSHL